MFKQIKSLLFLALCISPVYGVGPLQSSRYFDNTDGLIDHISPLRISEKNATAISNITLNDRGQLSKRTGYSIINSTGNLTTSPVTGGGYHEAATGSSFFGVVVGTNVYKSGNTFAGTFTNVTGTTTITDSSSNLVQTTNLNDTLIFCNELDKPFKLGSTGNAVHLSTGLFTNAKTCSTYGSYLVIANTTESSTAYPSRVRWSDIQAPDVFPANNYIDIEPNDGDKIVSIITFEDSIYIFKKRSIYRMIITGLDGADAFIIRPAVRNIGAWAKLSVRVIPNVGIAFLAQNTAYVLSDNGLEPIGDVIQGTFDGLSRSAWTTAVGAIYPKEYQYWLSVTGSGTTNTKILVYDYIQKSWTIFDNIKANMLEQAEDSTGQNVLISGDYLGNVYMQDSGTVDEPSNVSTAISASYTTADLFQGSPEITKNYKYLYVFSQVDSTTTVTINGNYDYDASTITYTAALSLGQTGAVYDTAVYDVDTYPSSQYKTSRIELNRSAKAIKLNFMNAATEGIMGIIGWVIVYQIEDYRE